MNKLTQKQKEFYLALKYFIDEKKYTPSIRELGEIMCFSSTATTHFYMKALEKKGFIKRINNRHIEIIKESE